MGFVLKNNTTVQITDSTGVKGWGYAEAYTTSAGVTGQIQRWVLKPGYVAPPTGSIALGAAPSAYNFTTLTAWARALSSGAIWTPNAGYTYVKANCLAYAASPSPTSTPPLPDYPSPTPPTALTSTTSITGASLDPSSTVPPADAGIYLPPAGGALRIVGTFLGLPIDVVVSPAGAQAALSTMNAALQLDFGPSLINQNNVKSRAFTEVASYWVGTSPRQAIEHWALDPSWQTPDAKQASVGQPPTTERPQTFSAWAQLIQSLGWPTGSRYVIAACNYYHGTYPNPL